jgi:hypothetical protein
MAVQVVVVLVDQVMVVPLAVQVFQDWEIMVVRVLWVKVVAVEAAVLVLLVLMQQVQVQ